MPSFYYCLAIGPLAVYLLLVGWINLRRRPLVVNGSRELAALGVAVAGFLMIGPMRLFLPEPTAQRFGWLVWVLMLSFYGLSLTLWMLVARPRLVIYNLRASRLRPLLSELALQLDADARWAGDSLALPQMGVQLRVEGFAPMRSISLIANSGTQSFSGWRRLERGLRQALLDVEVQPNPRGVGMLLAGFAMLASLVYEASAHPQAIAQGFLEMIVR